MRNYPEPHSGGNNNPNKGQVHWGGSDNLKPTSTSARIYVSMIAALLPPGITRPLGLEYGCWSYIFRPPVTYAY